ncbi:oxidoreductase-like domain-containing protein [Pseudoalteromonas sp.]|uniref:oxidoreductase-like domain-containing protein n=1 Tax=Pseudoalteromonas sp. TaxID=53249 RepID=UPI0035690793
MQENIPSTKPERPKSDECCGGGSCCPCVWDEYKEKLAAWKKHHGENINNKSV